MSVLMIYSKSLNTVQLKDENAAIYETKNQFCVEIKF